MRPYGLLAAVVLLLAVEVGVSRQEWVWTREPCSDAGVVDALETTAADAATEPRIVFLGSSRVQGGIAPRELEHDLGLPPNSVLNLALTGGTPFDSQVVYNRNRALLRRAALVVVGVEDWYVNIRVEPGERDRRFASLGDRLSNYTARQSVELLCGWVWRTYDARDALRRWVTTAGSGKALSFSEDGRVRWQEEPEFGPESVDVAASVEYYFRYCAFGGARLEQVGSLLDRIEGDGPKAAVIQVPWRDAYLAARARLAPLVEPEYKARLSGLARSRPTVPFLLYERASDLGMSATHFYDYGHMTTAGAREFTRLVAPKVAALLAARDSRRTGEPDSHPSVGRCGPG